MPVFSVLQDFLTHNRPAKKARRGGAGAGAGAGAGSQPKFDLDFVWLSYERDESQKGRRLRFLKQLEANCDRAMDDCLEAKREELIQDLALLGAHLVNQGWFLLFRCSDDENADGAKFSELSHFLAYTAGDDRLSDLERLVIYQACLDACEHLVVSPEVLAAAKPYLVADDFEGDYTVEALRRAAILYFYREVFNSYQFSWLNGYVREYKSDSEGKVIVLSLTESKGGEVASQVYAFLQRLKALYGACNESPLPEFKAKDEAEESSYLKFVKDDEDSGASAGAGEAKLTEPTRKELVALSRGSSRESDPDVLGLKLIKFGKLRDEWCRATMKAWLAAKRASMESFAACQEIEPFTGHLSGEDIRKKEAERQAFVDAGGAVFPAFLNYASSAELSSAIYIALTILHEHMVLIVSDPDAPLHEVSKVIKQKMRVWLREKLATLEPGKAKAKPKKAKAKAQPKPKPKKAKAEAEPKPKPKKAKAAPKKAKAPPKKVKAQEKPVTEAVVGTKSGDGSSSDFFYSTLTSNGDCTTFYSSSAGDAPAVQPQPVYMQSKGVAAKKAMKARRDKKVGAGLSVDLDELRLPVSGLLQEPLLAVTQKLYGDQAAVSGFVRYILRLKRFIADDISEESIRPFHQHIGLQGRNKELKKEVLLGCFYEMMVLHLILKTEEQFLKFCVAFDLDFLEQVCPTLAQYVMGFDFSRSNYTTEPEFLHAFKIRRNDTGWIWCRRCVFQWFVKCRDAVFLSGEFDPMRSTDADITALRDSEVSLHCLIAIVFRYLSGTPNIKYDVTLDLRSGSRDEDSTHFWLLEFLRLNLLDSGYGSSEDLGSLLIGFLRERDKSNNYVSARQLFDACSKDYIKFASMTAFISFLLADEEWLNLMFTDDNLKLVISKLQSAPVPVSAPAPMSVPVTLPVPSLLRSVPVAEAPVPAPAEAPIPPAPALAPASPPPATAGEGKTVTSLFLPGHTWETALASMGAPLKNKHARDEDYDCDADLDVSEGEGEEELRGVARSRRRQRRR